LFIFGYARFETKTTARMRTITHIVLHCTAGPAQQPTNSIKYYWQKVLGWKSYGYHWLVGEDGTAERLTPDEQPSNGVKGYNSHAIHLCYKGGWDGTDTRTVAQKEKLLELVTNYKRRFPAAKVCGHRDLSPDLNGDGVITPNEFVKKCPCFNAIEEYANV
jgi:N-acetylmuramoyl-L-alanine amidase